MKQTFKLVFSVLLFCLMSWSSFAQSTTITGKVVDKDGLGVVGLNVIEKGTKNGVLTDMDGAYKIQVPKGAVLQFSFIGMKLQEKMIGEGAVVNVTMQEDNATLNEVIVVGYGTQKKNKLTGAIATIDMDRIQDLPVSNIAEALRGQIPGVSISGGSQRPGSAATVQIRQSFDFSKNGGSTLPLVVIDDMVQIDPQTGFSTLETLNRLDPSEIESITVLKDGSAAIYGSRASQGAIVVKTKRGKEGPLKFTYQSQFAINDAVSHSKTMNAYDYGVWANRFMVADNRAGTNNANLFSSDELEEMKSLNYDWLNKAWKVATQQKHALTVSGGTEKATYFAGVNYFTQGANLGKQEYNKWNFRSGMTAKLSKDLDFSASVSANTGHIQKSFTKATGSISDSSYGSKSNGGGEQQDYGYLLHMPKYIPWETTVNGQQYWMSPFPKTYATLGSANANNTIAGWNYFATVNNGSKSINDDFGYNVNTSLTYKVPFIKGLSFRGNYSRNETVDRTEMVQLPYTMARITNYYTEGNHLASAADPSVYNSSTNPTGEYAIETNVRNSRVYYDTNLTKATQANFFASYDRTFGDHDLSAMVGVEKSENQYTSTRLAYEGTTVDYLGTYKTAGTLSTSNSTADKVEGGTLSYLGRLNYSFRDKYLLELLFRSDASTKFAPENYWGFFPAAQVGWVISKEGWFSDNVSWVNNLKLRYSIGKTGKDNVAPWRWQQLYDIIADKGYQFGTSGGALSSGLSPQVNPNVNVGWDTSIKNNVGLDLSILKNRLQLTADFYYDRSYDMLTNMASAVGVPISIGGGFAEQNYSAVDAWGSEFSINWKDNIKDKFSYNIGVNFGFSDNKVKKYPEAALLHPSNNQTIAGASLIFPQWGFNVWKGTSTGDGILRTDEDIQNYWNYLTNQAAASGVTGAAPKYLDIVQMSDMRRGMLAYKDVGGAFDSTTGKQAVADGQITKNNDYVKLVNKNRTYGFTTNLGMNYKSFYLRSQIATSWGGYRAIDIVKQGTATANSYWAHESYWTDMYADDNVNGKYPNLAYYDKSSLGSPSDFWQLSTFRCVVRNLSLGFEIPKVILSPLKISNATFGVTGNNLWDLYNPYPDHYRNMYDSSYEAYPTLRTWTVNLNISF